MGKAYLEASLPGCLQYDIDALKKGMEEKSDLMDCLLDEVYGFINSALYSYEIPDEQARYLREKYLGM